MGAGLKEFWRKFAAAFATAGWLYAPVHLGFGWTFDASMNPTFSGAAEAFRTQTLFSFFLMLGVIVAALFVIAYPLECRWDKKDRGPGFRTGRYVLIFLALGIGSILLYALLAGTHIARVLTDYPQGEWFVIIGIGSVVAAIIAAIARPIYPFLLRAPRVAITLALILLALGLSGVLFHQPGLAVVRDSAPVGTSFYPPRQNGELARGTWTLNKANGSYGTEFYISGDAMMPHGQYELAFACKPGTRPIKYQALIRNAENLKQVYKVNFTCADASVQYYTLASHPRAFVPQVILDNIDRQSPYHEAWAILAPWRN